MDYTVVWSPEATEDIESIAEYIARDSTFYACSVVSKLLAVARSIAEQPQLGRVVPELANDDIRERFVYSYRLVYNLNATTITVVAIIHGKRLLENGLGLVS